MASEIQNVASSFLTMASDFETISSKTKPCSYNKNRNSLTIKIFKFEFYTEPVRHFWNVFKQLIDYKNYMPS